MKKKDFKQFKAVFVYTRLLSGLNNAVHRTNLYLWHRPHNFLDLYLWHLTEDWKNAGSFAVLLLPLGGGAKGHSSVPMCTMCFTDSAWLVLLASTRRSWHRRFEQIPKEHERGRNQSCKKPRFLAGHTRSLFYFNRFLPITSCSC